MKQTRRPLVSVLVPAYNEEASVERAHAEISRVFAGLPDYDHEILFMDNHSTDRTFALLQGIAARDAHVRVIRFARNNGYDRSLLFAYQQARGDCSIQVDCDLQDPPDLIPQMLAKWERGHQVVYGIRRTLADGPVSTALRRWYYYSVNALSEDELPLNAGEFRLVDGCILRELRKVRDTNPYVRGLISAMGFSQVGIEYDRGERLAGESKFPLRRMIALGLDGVLNHSLVPLRVASAVGLIVGLVTMLLIIGYIVGRLIFGQNWPAGFATTTLLLLLAITLNALFLGIIGEYLGRIFMQLKGRAFPVVEVEIDRSLTGQGASMPTTSPAAKAPVPAEH